jgi:hypothetical protein
MEKKAAYFFISCCKEEHFHAGTWAVKPRFNAVRPDSPLRYHHYIFTLTQHCEQSLAMTSQREFKVNIQESC